MQTTSKIDSALAYASWGWHVLPVVPNGKTPATAHGVHDATTDAEQIKAWWGQNPNFNIGIAAGEKSGIVVFDIDPRNGGDTSWQGWIAEHGSPPDCAMALMSTGPKNTNAAGMMMLPPRTTSASSLVLTADKPERTTSSPFLR